MTAAWVNCSPRGPGTARGLAFEGPVSPLPGTIPDHWLSQTWVELFLAVGCPKSRFPKGPHAFSSSQLFT